MRCYGTRASFGYARALANTDTNWYSTSSRTINHRRAERRHPAIVNKLCMEKARADKQTMKWTREIYVLLYNTYAHMNTRTRNTSNQYATCALTRSKCIHVNMRHLSRRCGGSFCAYWIHLVIARRRHPNSAILAPSGSIEAPVLIDTRAAANTSHNPDLYYICETDTHVSVLLSELVRLLVRRVADGVAENKSSKCGMRSRCAGNPKRRRSLGVHTQCPSLSLSLSLSVSVCVSGARMAHHIMG